MLASAVAAPAGLPAPCLLGFGYQWNSGWNHLYYLVCVYVWGRPKHLYLNFHESIVYKMQGGCIQLGHFLVMYPHNLQELKDSIGNNQDVSIL